MNKADRDIAKLSQQYNQSTKRKALELLEELDALDEDESGDRMCGGEDSKRVHEARQRATVERTRFNRLLRATEVPFSATYSGDSSGSVVDNLFACAPSLLAALEIDLIVPYCIKTAQPFPDHLCVRLYELAAKADSSMSIAAARNLCAVSERGLCSWAPSPLNIHDVLLYYGAHTFSYPSSLSSSSSSSSSSSLSSSSSSSSSSLVPYLSVRSWLAVIESALKNPSRTALRSVDDLGALLEMLLLLGSDQTVHELCSVSLMTVIDALITTCGAEEIYFDDMQKKITAAAERVVLQPYITEYQLLSILALVPHYPSCSAFIKTFCTTMMTRFFLAGQSPQHILCIYDSSLSLCDNAVDILDFIRSNSEDDRIWAQSFDLFILVSIISHASAAISSDWSSTERQDFLDALAEVKPSVRTRRSTNLFIAQVLTTLDETEELLALSNDQS